MKRAALSIGLILFAFASVSLAADLVFTEGNNFTEDGSFMVVGFVKNTSNYAMKDINITVKYYDKAGNFLRFENTSTNPPVLQPAGEASYRVAIPADKRIASIKKTARWAIKEEN